MKLKNGLIAALILSAALIVSACGQAAGPESAGEPSLVVTGGEATGEAAASGGAALTGETASGPAEGGLFGGGMSSILLIYGGVLGGIYFLMIRPQRKREKEAKAMLAALAVGDNIMTSGGFFGVITAVGDDCFVVEFGTNKGVRVPVRKADIVAKRTPNITASRETEEDKK